MKTPAPLLMISMAILVILGIWCIFKNEYGQAGIVLALAAFNYATILEVTRK